MLFEAAIAAVLIVPVMMIAKTVAYRLGQTGWNIVPFQMLSVGALFLILGSVTSLPLSVAVVGTFIPLIINIIASVHNILRKRRALRGEYGPETQWAAELVEEGHYEFAHAVETLPERELMEIGVMAESKEELYEITVERLDEITEDSVPQEF